MSHLTVEVRSGSNSSSWRINSEVFRDRPLFITEKNGSILSPLNANLFASNVGSPILDRITSSDTTDISLKFKKLENGLFQNPKLCYVSIQFIGLPLVTQKQVYESLGKVIRLPKENPTIQACLAPNSILYLKPISQGQKLTIPSFDNLLKEFELDRSLFPKENILLEYDVVFSLFPTSTHISNVIKNLKDDVKRLQPADIDPEKLISNDLKKLLLSRPICFKIDPLAKVSSSGN
jgi:hypothetical protein